MKYSTFKIINHIQPNRIAASFFSLAMFVFACGQVCGAQLLPTTDDSPPMPASMPPLPPDQKPEVEALPQVPPAHKVVGRDLQRVSALFEENGLSLENLMVTRIVSLPKNPAYVSVETQLHYHNLLVADAYEMFRFKDGKLVVPAIREDVLNRLKALAAAEIPVKATITRWQVIEGLRQHVRLDPMQKGEAEGNVNAHLLIIDVAGRGEPEKYILAWKVSIEAAAITAAIDATSGKMFSYFNGINH